MPAKTFYDILKGNPYHDEKGRFTTGPKAKNPMIRTDPPPKKTKTAYKVFVARNGKLYPPMVANPDGMDTPVGVWLDAAEGTLATDKDGNPITNTLGRNKVKAGGKGTQGGSGTLAYRPGWHLGELPEAKQFYTKDKVTGEKKQKKNFVWAECEIAADLNYQDEAMSYGYNKNGKFQHSLAGLPKIPKDGYYTYRTNPDPSTQPWYITGSMKVNRILTDKETNAILRSHGIEPMKRDGGELDLKALGFTETNFINKSEEAAQSFSVFKTDDDKRLVFGWASISITVDGEQLEDRQKDIIDPEDLEEAAYEYVLNFRDTGEEHVSTMRKKGKLVESCVFTAEKQKAIGIPEGILPVGWWIGFKIEDDAAWERVKNGTYRMFSIEGKANRVPVEKAVDTVGKTFSDVLKMNIYHGKDGKFTTAAAGGGIVPTRKQEEVRNAIRSLPGCDKDGNPEENAEGHTTEFCNVPFPYVGDAVTERLDKFIDQENEDYDRLWSESNTSIKTVNISSLQSAQKVLTRGHLETLMDTWKSESDNEVRVVRHNRQNILVDGNHRTTLAKLTGKTSVKARIYDADKHGIEKSAQIEKTFSEILKFNPYHDAKGRFSNANGYASFTIQTKDPKKQHWADKAVARLKEKETAQKPEKKYDSHGFADYDEADYHQLHSGAKYYKQQQLTPKQKQAAANYLEAKTEPGSLYSHSQNLNYKMATDQPLTGKYKQTHDGMMDAMHNMGYNVELTRYDHAGMVNGLLKAAGAGINYEKMSESAIKKALIGQTLNENKFLSASYNNFKNAPDATVFTSRAVKINYKVKADTQVMMPGKGPGGDFGEIVLAPTNGKTNKAGKITGVRLTGEMVRRQGTEIYDQPRIEIDIEIGWLMR